MATVKIIAENKESFEEIEENLIKAFQNKSDDSLLSKRFDDPLINFLVDELDGIFLKDYPLMIKEVVDVLKEP